MVSIMAMLTTKSTREVCLEVVVVFPPLEFIVISPLGVLVPPSRLVCVGGCFPLVPGYYCFCFFLYFWNYLTNGMDFPYSFVQNFEIAEWERAEKS
jgi:hypothetical protein